jgi:hypothetical protein
VTVRVGGQSARSRVHEGKEQAGLGRRPGGWARFGRGLPSCQVHVSRGAPPRRRPRGVTPAPGLLTGRLCGCPIVYRFRVAGSHRSSGRGREKPLPQHRSTWYQAPAASRLDKVRPAPPCFSLVSAVYSFSCHERVRGDSALKLLSPQARKAADAEGECPKHAAEGLLLGCVRRRR